MRKAAALLALVALGGCYYDRPNPWNTSGDVEALEEKTHEDWMLYMQEPYRHPQEARRPWVDPDLEAWRDTVLASADSSSLSRIRTVTLKRIAQLEKQRGGLMRLDPINAETALTRNGEMLRTERLRLKLLDAHSGE